MKNLFQSFRFTPAVIALIAMNLLPLIGVFGFGWDAGTIVFLYWLENVVIGLLNIPKILSCRAPHPDTPPAAPIAGRFSVPDLPTSKRQPIGAAIFLCVFFSFHYGMFCFGHYMFLKTTYRQLPAFSEMLSALTGTVLFWSLLGLTFSHIISMVVNFYGKNEYVGRSPNAQMFMPYSRIVLLHVVIILSGFVALATGQGTATILLLVLFKIGFDLAAHTVEHEKIESWIAPRVG
jgi:hypothetical protein